MYIYPYGCHYKSSVYILYLNNNNNNNYNYNKKNNKKFYGGSIEME